MDGFEGSFFEDLRQLEFEEKRRVQCTSGAVGAIAVGGDPLIQGIYPDEESVDLSTLLSFDDSYPGAAAEKDSLATTASNSSLLEHQSVGYSTADNIDRKPNSSPSAWPQGACSELSVNFSFRNYLPLPSSTSSTHNLSMYDVSSGIGSNQSNMPVNVETIPVQSVSTNPTSHQIAPIGMSPQVGSRPAPGKTMRTKKKRMPEKGTTEYRVKRDRNNVAVRKSREKSKIRVMETEQRVKELEDENQRLQSKITLLTKELNVLKSLFTSAGVSQPAATLKDQAAARN